MSAIPFKINKIINRPFALVNNFGYRTSTISYVRVTCSIVVETKTSERLFMKHSIISVLKVRLIISLPFTERYIIAPMSINIKYEQI
jgi:hypothetical protein